MHKKKGVLDESTGWNRKTSEERKEQLEISTNSSITSQNKGTETQEDILWPTTRVCTRNRKIPIPFQLSGYGSGSSCSSSKVYKMRMSNNIYQEE